MSGIFWVEHINISSVPQVAQEEIDVQEKTLFSKEQLRPDVQWLRGEWVEYIKYIDVSHLVYLDEFSVNKR